jgi:hypothetical protein
VESPGYSFIKKSLSKSYVIKREKEIKLQKSKKYIEELIFHAGGRPD